jgi:hypothetical protein
MRASIKLPETILPEWLCDAKNIIYLKPAIEVYRKSGLALSLSSNVSQREITGVSC